MCCIGQFSEQAGKVVGELQGFTVLPNGCPIKEFSNLSNIRLLSKLAEEAMGINDNKKTRPATKAAALQELFLKHGHTIELVNFPEEVLKESQDV
jgi:hypothetical protein